MATLLEEAQELERLVEEEEGTPQSVGVPVARTPWGADLPKTRGNRRAIEPPKPETPRRSGGCPVARRT